MNRVAALFLLLLISVTWPLWFGTDNFPTVPLLSSLRHVAPAADRAVAVIFFAAVVTIVVKPETDRSKAAFGSNVAAIVSGIVLCVLNQHRLQPWNVLFLLMATIHVVIKPPHRIRVCRVTVAMIYICAALSRFGPRIDEGVSRQILDLGLNAIGLARLNQSPLLIRWTCAGMSVIELIAGLLLLTNRFRIFGVVLAMAIHATLLLSLSPLGLNHNTGVLLWNAFFLTLLPMLRERDSRPETEAVRSAPAMPMLARIALVIVVVFPLSGLFGIADNWPSWQLYSPRPEVLRIFVRSDAIGELPDFVKTFVGDPAPLDMWCPVRIDRWSLEATGAPIYPEDRFQLGVAQWLARHLKDPGSIRAELDAPERPLWWKRQHVTYADSAQVQQAAQQFVLNARPAKVP
ncbi:MAG: hypothetical protein R3C19_00130 [Planctomycetaceae bacterium]